MSKEDLPSTDNLLLTAESLSKKVTSPEGQLTILDAVSFAVRRGETVAIVGPSGAGKSTLLALLAGLDESSSGRVRFNGVELTALDEDGRAALRNRAVGFIFQSFHLLPSLTAIENVMLPLELARERDARPRAREAMARVGLERRLRHYPRQLSGGEQQRVAIARAFVTQPVLLFADEPTGNLDRDTGRHILNLLFDLNSANGTTLVLVTHDLEAAGRCDRIIELSGGKIQSDSESRTANAKLKPSDAAEASRELPEAAEASRGPREPAKATLDLHEPPEAGRDPREPPEASHDAREPAEASLGPRKTAEASLESREAANAASEPRNTAASLRVADAP